ncbi:hypothetical protein NLU13_7355 [Sarocladium strictum]|uniref:NAD-dependent epimerase/dehydratase domain-containing protein n=1 Tax=Sarocladium strictum TaxID=5046 RepID=A0AA39GCM8_SARSR|nr:hypothetical protein NLU13_7355 [Sarocladium strictum]
MAKTIVFLTGASGFLGSHIAAELLRAGYSVRASFRTRSKSDEFVKFFAEGQIQTCIVPDITAPGAYDSHLADCTYAIHCASPYMFKIEDVAKDLIDPAVQGTKEILRAVAATPSVKRIVITSSFASVINPFEGPRKGYTYTEEDWNPITTEQIGDNKIFGYLASKKLAEQTAWEFLKQQSRQGEPFTLVTVCPPMIFGPAHPAANLSVARLNESWAQLLAAVKGENSGPARMPVFVDVRDAARIHVAALGQSTVPHSERFVVCGGKYTWQAVRRIAQGHSVGKESLVEADEFYSIDASKVEKMLGVEWTSLEDCVKDFKSALGI